MKWLGAKPSHRAILSRLGDPARTKCSLRAEQDPWLLCLRYSRHGCLPHHPSHLCTTLALPEQLSTTPGPAGPWWAGEPSASSSIPARAASPRSLLHGQLDLFLGTALCCFPCQQPRLFSSVVEPCGRLWLSFAFLEAST